MSDDFEEPPPWVNLPEATTEPPTRPAESVSTPPTTSASSRSENATTSRADTAITRLLARFPYQPGKTPENFPSIPEKLKGIEELRFRRAVAEVWLSTEKGQEWARRTEPKNDRSDQWHP